MEESFLMKQKALILLALVFAYVANAQNSVTWLTDISGLPSLNPVSTRRVAVVGNITSGYKVWNFDPNSTASTNTDSVIAYTGLATGRWLALPLAGNVLALTNKVDIFNGTATNLAIFTENAPLSSWEEHNFVKSDDSSSNIFYTPRIADLSENVRPTNGLGQTLLPLQLSGPADLITTSNALNANITSATNTLASNVILKASGTGTNLTLIQSTNNAGLTMYTAGAPASTGFKLYNGQWNVFLYGEPVPVFQPVAANKEMAFDIQSSSWDRDAWIDLFAPMYGTNYDGTNFCGIELRVFPTSGYAMYSVVNGGVSNKLDCYFGSGVINANKRIGIGEFNATFQPAEPLAIRFVTDKQIGYKGFGVSGIAEVYHNDANNAQIPAEMASSSYLWSVDILGTDPGAGGWRVRPAAGKNFTISGPSTDLIFSSTDDAGTSYISINNRASGTLWSIDQFGTRLVPYQWRPLTNVNVSFDGPSASTARLAAFNDAGTSIPLRYQSSSHAWTTDGGSTYPLILSNSVVTISNPLVQQGNVNIATSGSGAVASVKISATKFGLSYDGTQHQTLFTEIRPATNEIFSIFDSSGKLVLAALTDALGVAPMQLKGQSFNFTHDGSNFPLIVTNNVAYGLFHASGAAPTCTGATIGTGSTANAGFVTTSTTGTSTIVITFPKTATTGWSVTCGNQTTANLIRQTASSTTTATLVGVTVSGDVINFIAMPY